MLKAKRRVNALLWVVVGIILLVGIIFASVFFYSQSIAVPVYKTAVDVKAVMQENLSNVSIGETVIDSASFTTRTDSGEVYVRANIRYYVNSTMTSKERKFLLAVNYKDITTSTGTNYKWVRGSDEYYYLTDTSGNPLKVSGATTTTYNICESVIYTGPINVADSIETPSDLMLKLEVQTMSTKNISTDSVADKFEEYFGNNYTLGYVVTFDADGASNNPPAQIFLSNNGTVKCPATPSKQDYIFQGWYLGTNVYNFDTLVTSNLNIKAVYIKGYTVTINKGEHITSVTVTANEKEVTNGDLVPENTVLTISATATSGYIASWTVLVGSGTPTSNATSVTATDDVTIDVIGELPKATLPKTYLTTLGITDATTINTITFYDSVSEAESVIGSTIMGTQLNAGVTTDNGTVYGLAVANTTDTSKYDIHIASDGIIRFPADSSSFFYKYTNLTAINNLEIVDFSEVTNTESMIYYCSKLTSVNFGQNCGLNNIGQSTFYYCEGLTNMVMPDSVTTIGVQAFMGCKSLESITIPSSVNSIGSGAFGGCGLVSVEVESGNTTYDSRDNCNAIIKTSTNELVVGCKNTVIPSSVVSIGAEAFRGCSGLTSISIPSTVTEIGSWAFAYCSGLTSINIPSGVTAISEYTFYYCTGLVTVTIPEGVTSIGGHALFWCNNIKKLIIPSTVTTVGDNAMNTTAVKSYIVVKGTNVTLGDHSFGGKANMVYVFCENSTVAYNVRNTLTIQTGPMVLYKSSDTLTGTQVWKAYDDEMIGRIGETERLYLDGAATNYFRIVGTTDVYKKIS